MKKVILHWAFMTISWLCPDVRLLAFNSDSHSTGNSCQALERNIDFNSLVKMGWGHHIPKKERWHRLLIPQSTTLRCCNNTSWLMIRKWALWMQQGKTGSPHAGWSSALRVGERLACEGRLEPHKGGVDRHSRIEWHCKTTCPTQTELGLELIQSILASHNMSWSCWAIAALCTHSTWRAKHFKANLTMLLIRLRGWLAQASWEFRVVKADS